MPKHACLIACFVSCVASFVLVGDTAVTAVAADGNLPPAPPADGEMDRLWKVEQKRIKEKLNDGDYNAALGVSRIFEREFEKAKKKMTVPQLQDSAFLIRHATVRMFLIRAACELYCGNSGTAKTRLLQAESRLLDNKRLGGARYQAILAAWTEARRRSDFAKEMLQGFPAALQGTKVHLDLWLEYRFQDWKAKQLRPSLDAFGSLVYETERDLILTYDALAAMLIDESMPVRAESARILHEAESYFDRSQSIRERNFQGVATAFSLHGDQQTTFLRNYGRLFLKQAELKHANPKLFKDHTVADLLDRAQFYLVKAKERFADWDMSMRGFQTLVHEGSLSSANKAIHAKLEDLNANRQEADAFMEDFRLVCIGYADLNFNLAEYHLMRARLASEDGDLEVARESLDESEQALLNGADMLSLVTAKADHPFLIYTYCGLAAVAAQRLGFLGQEPSDDLKEYIDLAEGIMKSRGLKETTVQGRYLARAKSVCEQIQQADAQQ